MWTAGVEKERLFQECLMMKMIWTNVLHMVEISTWHPSQEWLNPMYGHTWVPCIRNYLLYVIVRMGTAQADVFISQLRGDDVRCKYLLRTTSRAVGKWEPARCSTWTWAGPAAKLGNVLGNRRCMQSFLFPLTIFTSSVQALSIGEGGGFGWYARHGWVFSRDTI